MQRLLQAMMASCKEVERIRYGVLAHKKERGFCPTSSVLGTFTARDIEFVASVRYPNQCHLVLFLQIFERAPSWMLLPEATRPGTKDLVRLLLKFKASYTASRYLKEIDKFCCWCQSFRVAISPPLNASIVLAYLQKVYLRSSSYSLVVLAHALLKWFHTLLLVSTLNPLDSVPWKQLSVQSLRSLKRNQLHRI